MKAEWLYRTFSLAIILLLFYLFYHVISPFLKTLAWSMVLSITFYPLNRLFLKYVKKPWAASLATLLVILLIMLGPFTYIVGSLAGDISQVYRLLEEKGFESLPKIQEHPWVAGLFERMSSYKMFENFDLQSSVVSTLKEVGKAVAQHTKDIFKNAVLLIVNFILMCITTFYFLKDGNTLAIFIKKLLPFSEQQKDRLEERVKEMVIAAIYGGLAVAVAQGILGGIAFWIFGLASPVFWGTVMAIFSLVPLFGCTTIWLPTGLYLLLSGSYAKGIGFLIYCALLIATIDNIIKPLVIGGRTKLHTLLVFFSVLGGINFLGFLGFILGPLIAALCLSLLEIYTFDEQPGARPAPEQQA
ncbi:MAG: AI-2E family transporter [Nitrospiraceae bacterium]|nr:MAG: AI-2E family transporter [Nitrospiraceae bacterium]